MCIFRESAFVASVDFTVLFTLWLQVQRSQTAASEASSLGGKKNNTAHQWKHTNTERYTSLLLLKAMCAGGGIAAHRMRLYPSDTLQPFPELISSVHM